MIRKASGSPAGGSDKVKISTNISPEGAEAIVRIRESMRGVYTVGGAIDAALAPYADMSPGAAAMIVAMIDREITSVRRRVDALAPEDAMERGTCEEVLERLAAMRSAVSVSAAGAVVGNDDRTEGLRRIGLRDGGYATVPAEWPVLNGWVGDVAEVRVVATRHAAKWGVPANLVWLRIHDGPIDRDEEANIAQLATEAFPSFAEVLERQVDPLYGESGDIINADEYMDAPVIGYFALVDAGLAPRVAHVPGAMVHRKR